jgi:hypothetical protein
MFDIIAQASSKKDQQWETATGILHWRTGQALTTATKTVATVISFCFYQKPIGFQNRTEPVLSKTTKTRPVLLVLKPGSHFSLRQLWYDPLTLLFQDLHGFCEQHLGGQGSGGLNGD